MLQQLAFHKQQTVKAARVQDLDPRPCSDNVHESVLAHEMTVIEPSEIPPFPDTQLETFGFPKPHQASFER
jgi:hypothetical protein